MEAKDLRKQTISGLVLNIMNEKNSDSIRKFAEIELKKRIKNLGTSYEEIMEIEGYKIETRGTDINNYLITPRPTLQQLMEVYFEYKYRREHMDNELLLSELHLCNDMSLKDDFFDKICSNEIANLQKRISSESSDNKQVLSTFKFALEKRQREIAEKRKKISGIYKLELNEVLENLTFSDPLSPRTNLSDEKKYKIACSKILNFNDEIINFLSNTLLDYDVIQYLYGYKKVLEDSARLKSQKELLLRKAAEQEKIDYTTPTMQKVYKRLISTEEQL